MIKRNNTPPAPARSRWRTYVLIFTCGLLTVSGFFLAGRQHFAWMDYGMKNSRLRKQIEDLEGEKRRLLLAREISLSPSEIKKAAKRVGLGELEGDATVAQVSGVTKNKAVPATTGAPTLASATASTKPMVTRTAAVTPAPQAVPASFKKIDKTSKLVAKLTAAE